MEKEIKITTQLGEEYFVRFSIPTSIASDEQAVWCYICHWIDENIKDAKEWEM